MPASPERIARSKQRMKAKFALISQGICPECKQAMQPRQSGRCVEARPCGHVLYTGQLSH